MKKYFFTLLMLNAFVCQATENYDKYIDHLKYLKRMAEMDMAYFQNSNVHHEVDRLMYEKASGRFEAYSLAIDLYKVYENQSIKNYDKREAEK